MSIPKKEINWGEMGGADSVTKGLCVEVDGFVAKDFELGVLHNQVFGLVGGVFTVETLKKILHGFGGWGGKRGGGGGE